MKFYTIYVSNTPISTIESTGRNYYKIKDVCIAMGIGWQNLRYKIPELFIRAFGKSLYVSGTGIITVIENKLKKQGTVLKFAEEFTAIEKSNYKHEDKKPKEGKSQQMLVKELIQKYKEVSNECWKLKEDYKKLQEENEQMKSQLKDDSIIEELEELLKN